MSLRHYWMFSEAAGSTSSDTVGGGVASVVGDVSGESVVLGGFGRGRDLESVTSPPGGYSGYLDLDLPGAAEIPEWSMVIRFKLNAGFDMSAGPLPYSVLGFFGDASWTKYLDMYINTLGTKLVTYSEVDGGVLDASYTKPSGDFSDGIVTLIIISNAFASSVRVNGTSLTMVSNDAVPLLLTEYARIGAYDDGQGDAPMTVYELAIFDHGLTSTERNLIETGLPAIVVDPVALSQHAAVTRPPESLAVKTEPAVLLSSPASLIVKTEPAVLLQSPTGYVFSDWTSLFNALEIQYYYACDITDGSTTLRKPISSWQATINANGASFAQAVFPNAAEIVGQIAAMGEPEFVIYKGVRLGDGSVREEEICRAPIQTPLLSEGATNTTLTLQGYTTFGGQPGAARELINIRTQSNRGGLRVRCDIDFFLRPGQTAIARGSEFIVSYINYYANADDNWMEVGE